MASRSEGCRILDCHVHHTGAAGIEVTASGSGADISRNHIHHVGCSYPSAISLSASGSGLHIARNEIHDGPYSGIVCNGTNHRIEQNLIYRVMREMQDGAGIYGHLVQSVLRGNVVRDVATAEKGYGVFAYYLDEQARDCVVERNVSVGVEKPIFNHIARDIIIRDNVFMAEGDMSLLFSRSARCTFEGNTLFVPGKITIIQPNAIKLWTNNVVFSDSLGKDGAPRPFAISDAMPPVGRPGSRRSRPSGVARRRSGTV